MGLPPTTENVISGNTFNGVYLGDSGTSGNEVQMNFITFNGQQGVMIANGASSNSVFEATIGGNYDNGVEMNGAGTSGNTLLDVTITDNTVDGVLFTNGASGDSVTAISPTVSFIEVQRQQRRRGRRRLDGHHGGQLHIR